MAKWNQTPAPQLIYQPRQMEFLDARRLRTCKTCKVDGQPYIYKAFPPIDQCDRCGQKGQRNFDYLTIIAGRRFGKSRFGSIAGAEEASFENTLGWACAPTVPKLHRYVIPAFQSLIPRDAVADWNSEFLDLRLKNGSLIHFQTLEHPDQGRGQGLDWLWIDEVCELTRNHWNVISPSLDDKLGVAFFTTTPRGYDWVYEEFYAPAERKVPGFWALHARTSDNPKFQTPEGLARLAQKKAQMSDLMFRQEYEADFVTFQGSIYGDVLKEEHILRSDDEVRQLIPEWPRIDPSRLCIIGMDTGTDHPFGGVKLVSTEGGMVVVGEYLERHRSFQEHATSLKNEAQPSIELTQHGLRPIWMSENDQTLGIERVKTWLLNDQLYFVAATAPKTIQQMKSYRWDENFSPKDEQKKKEKVFKKNDELPDCIRYALMTWPQLPKAKLDTQKGRDLSKLAPEVQQRILRERKADEIYLKKEQEESDNYVADFWS
jgi:hypothetical protein